MKNITLLTIAMALFGFAGLAHSMEDLKQAWQTAITKTQAAVQPYVDKAKGYLADQTITGKVDNNLVCEAYYNDLLARFNAAKANNNTATLSALDNEINDFFAKNPHCKTAPFFASGKIQSLQTRTKAELSGAKSNFK